MQEIDYTGALFQRWKTVVLFGVLAAVAGAGISFLFPLEYSATTRLLVVQRQLTQSDPYTAIRASEQIADSLGKIIYTTSFFDKVVASKYAIDKSIFSNDEIKRRKQWRKMIATRVERGSGILVVTAYHKDPQQAIQIARAVATVETLDGPAYLGGGYLQVRLVDDPIQSRYPVRPNVPVNALTGFIIGAIVGAAFAMRTIRRYGVFGMTESSLTAVPVDGGRSGYEHYGQ